MTSYIAVHSKKGIYLGVYAGHALFSGAAIAFSSKAIRFDEEAAIHEFFKKSLPDLAKNIKAIAIETSSTSHYVDVADILRSGYKEHTMSMVDNIPMINENIH
jgi:hypothetical protein